jgi:hypothetical protein
MTRSEFIKGIKTTMTRNHWQDGFLARMEIIIGKPGKENLRDAQLVRYDKLLSPLRFEADTDSFLSKQTEIAEEMWQNAINLFPDGLRGIEVLA